MGYSRLYFPDFILLDLLGPYRPYHIGYIILIAYKLSHKILDDSQNALPICSIFDSSLSYQFLFRCKNYRRYIRFQMVFQCRNQFFVTRKMKILWWIPFIPFFFNKSRSLLRLFCFSPRLNWMGTESNLRMDENEPSRNTSQSYN